MKKPWLCLPCQESSGTFEESEMIVGLGKFGPYVKHDGKFYSLKKGVDDPYTITEERAAELIREKREGDKHEGHQ
ncbi:MAG: hypothetical protein MZV63_47800 [Marinilabiliales bacterium]|nr:hypothetical protein [Marinilabiliales bacterium]